jgi:hypothetical protein
LCAGVEKQCCEWVLRNMAVENVLVNLEEGIR